MKHILIVTLIYKKIFVTQGVCHLINMVPIEIEFCLFCRGFLRRSALRGRLSRHWKLSTDKKNEIQFVLNGGELSAAAKQAIVFKWRHLPLSIEPLFWHPPFFFVSTLQSSTLPSFAVLAAQFGEARRWSEESWRKKPRSSTSIRNQRLPWSWPVRSRMGLHWAPPIQTHLTTICYHTIFLIQIQITGRYVSFSIAFYALPTPTRIILHQAVIQFLCSP